MIKDIVVNLSLGDNGGVVSKLCGLGCRSI
jgi:hypothetical protein